MWGAQRNPNPAMRLASDHAGRVSGYRKRLVKVGTLEPAAAPPDL